MRKRLLEQREQFVGGPAFAEAGVALSRHLAAVLSRLEPELLGLYWPHRSEFNAAAAIVADTGFSKLPIALPFARRAPVQLQYRLWDRRPPTAVDDCGVPAPSGAPVVPDVVLVPCVGFTRSGHRLGYGGGYFDRWLAQHPEVTAIGVAWSIAELDDGALVLEPHDQPLTLVVTERGVA